MNNDFLNDYIDGLYKQAQYISTSSEEYEMLKQASGIGAVARGLWTGGKYLLKTPFRDLMQVPRYVWSTLGKGFNWVTGKKLIGVDKVNRSLNRTYLRQLQDMDKMFGKNLSRSSGWGGKLARRGTIAIGIGAGAALPEVAYDKAAPYVSTAINTAVDKLPAGAQDAIVNPSAAAMEWYTEPKLREMAQITANMGPGWHTKLAISPDEAYQELEAKLRSHFWAPRTAGMIDEYMQGLREAGGRMHGVVGLVTPGWTAKHLETEAVNTLRRKTDAMRVAAGGKAKYDPKEIAATQNTTASDLAPFGIAAGGLGLMALNNWFNSDDDEDEAPTAGRAAGRAKGSQQPGVAYSNRYKKLYGRNFDELEAPDGDVRDLDYSRPV